MTVGLGLLAVTCMVVAGASSPSPTHQSVVLKVGWTDDPDNLNPFIGYNISSYEIFHLNYDFLVGYDAATLAPRPELAQSWSMSPDGLVWTFALRHGVKWQDGVPFTAKDVAFTYNYIMDNQLTAYLNYTYNIDSVTAVGDYTVVMHLKKPKSNMLRMWVPIVPEHIWSKVPGSTVATSYVNKPPIIGTGPFQVVQIKHGSFVRLQANKNYWRGAPHVNQVIFDMYQNASTMAMDLKTGAIDVATGVPIAQFRALQSAPGVKAVPTVWLGNDYIDCNSYNSPDSRGNPVLKDWHFRNALAYAIDRDKIVTVAYGGYATPGTSMIVPPLAYHWEPPADQKQVYDPAKAQQLLDVAGYKDTDGDGIRNDPATGKNIVLRLWTNADSNTGIASVKLIAGWFKDIGIATKIEAVDQGVLLDALYNYVGKKYVPDFDLIVWGIGQYPDPDPALSWLTTSQIQGWNDACWSNRQFDRLYVQQAETSDPAKRMQLVDEMEQLFYQQASQIELAYPRVLQAWRIDKWQGWVQSPGGDGAVIYTTDNIDSYTQVQPKTTTAGSAGSSSSWIFVIVGVIVVVVAVVIWRLVGRRNRAVESA